MAKTVAIVQSNYIPWKGYFDLIAAADVFVLYDEVQYTRRDWRNRNRIKTAQGPQWLTIPVAVKGRFTAPIREIEVSDREWGVRHWRTLRSGYARAPHFSDVAPQLESLYAASGERRLSDVNRRFLDAVCGMLEIDTPLRWSWEFSSSVDASAADASSRRLAEICGQAGGTVYLSGPSARAYLQEAPFLDRGIAVEYFDYSGYREYQQMHPPFDHHVSIVDLLFHTGREARRHLLRDRP